jgi:alkylation response protein AidB-like acyl-CoA dehydrogenase
MRSLQTILAAPPDPAPIESAEAWWQRHQAIARVEPAPIDQAILGGFSADRLGFAFASGYQAALRALVPDLAGDRVASFCITERGGGHPRAIETALEPRGDGTFRVTGRKRWATLAGDAGLLLVAASEGRDAAGKNRLRVARVLSTAAGVTTTPMAEVPFVPEIGHDEVELSGVVVEARDLLPGDGFARYIRPFRTVEDLHVQAALFGYLIREIRLHALPRELAERMAGILAALRSLAAEDPSAPFVHVALAGALELGRAPIAELEKVWARTESPAHARWERDRPLLTVAGQVRSLRIERAWKALASQDVSDDSTA